MAIGLLVVLGGCFAQKQRYRPLFEQNTTPLTMRHSALESHKRMIHVWRGLRENNPDLYAIRARLDNAWSRDPGWFEPYWGWGIFRLVQAGQTQPSLFTVECFTDSVRYLFMARSMDSFPDDEKLNIDMDIANSLNGLGACLLVLKEKDQANRALVHARDILASATPLTEDSKPRYFELQAYCMFYLGDIAAAKEAANEALKYGASLPEDFMAELAAASEELK